MTINHWELLRATSRTFFLSIQQLPGTVGEAMCLAYLMLRVSDFLEDNEFMPPQEKVRLLLLWDRIIAGEEAASTLVKELKDVDPEKDPDAHVAQQADQILEKLRQLPCVLQTQMLIHIRDSTRGMARWVEKGPQILTEEDLDDYMHEVAGRVGYLTTDIFAWYSRFVRQRLDLLMPLARETGLALQTVNIIRGLRKDYERGWIYIPESFCAAVNLQRADFFKPEYQIQALQVVDLLANKAERHLAAALVYIKSLPPWLHTLRLACMWPILFAVRTLAISRHNVGVLIGEVKMTRREVKRIVRETTLLGWNNHWLSRYFKQLQVVESGT